MSASKLLTFLLLSTLAVAQSTSTGAVIGGAVIGQNSNALMITTNTLTGGAVTTVYGPVTLQSSGGIGTLSWSVVNGALPNGISLSSAGVLSGTPSLAGNFTFTVQVVDQRPNNPQIAQQLLSIAVTCSPLSIPTGSPLTPGVVNSPYSTQIPVAGGVGPFSWTLPNDGLVPGLGLNGSGVLSGTPLATGTCLPTFTVVDSCNPPQTATGVLSLTIGTNSGALSISSTSPLPNAFKDSPYNFQLVAQGGTAPYTWSLIAGSLPTGLSIASSGVVSGTPTVAGATTGLTFHVLDNAGTTADLVNATINVLTPAAGDNRYANPNETCNFAGQTDGPSALPSNCMYTSMSAMAQSSPVVKTVCPSGCDFSTVQAAVTAAVCGWTIKIKAVTGAAQNVFNESVVVPATTCTATNWIIVETDQLASLPEGTRITPCAINNASLVGRPSYLCPTPSFLVPKIVSTTNAAALAVSAGTKFWRFIGIEFTTPSTTTSFQRKIINIGGQSGASGADHIILDRILCHAGDDPNGQSTQDGQGCIAAPSTYMALIDSYIYDTHCVTNCTDSQAISGGNGSNTQGPVKIVNNFLESSGQSFLFGGSAATITPHNIEIRRNHIFKPLFWKRCNVSIGSTSICGGQNSANNPAYFGTRFNIKNNGELKNASEVLIEGNIFENSWPESDQKGTDLLLSPKNQSSKTNTFQATSDGNGNLTKTSGSGSFNSNAVSPNCATPNQCIVTYNGTNYLAQTFTDANNVSVAPFPAAGGPFNTTQCNPGIAPNAVSANVIVRYNYLKNASRGMEIFSAQSDCGDLAQGIHNVSIHDNVMDNIDGFTWAENGGPCCQWSIGIRLTNGQPNGTQTHDISVVHNTILPLLSNASLGVGTSGFFNIDNADVTAPMFNVTLKDNLGIASPKDPSAAGGPTTVAGAMTTQDSTNSWCVQGNTWTTADVPGLSIDTPNTSSPGCPLVSTTNNAQPNMAAIKLVNFNNAVSGDYRLCHGVNNPTSACSSASGFINSATDGTDPGVNWNLWQQAISGVQ